MSASGLPIKVAPSILAADFLHLGDQLKAIEDGGAERVHVDIMDGHFVPNLSMGLPILEAVCRGTNLLVEVHLMIERPDLYVDRFAEAGSDQIIVHQEVSPHLHRTVQHIKGDLKKKVSVALNPSTPAGTLSEVIAELDGVLVMTVNPGFGGQKFIRTALPKIREVRRMAAEHDVVFDVEVDGGVDAETAPLAAEAGANLLVAGTSVFGHADGPAEGVRTILGCCAGIHP